MNQAEETEATQTDGGLFQWFMGTRRDEKLPNGIRTFEQNLEELHLCEASLQLIEREEHLFREKPEAEALKEHHEDTVKLAADHSKLKDLVLQTLQQNMSLNPREVSAEILTSAMKVLCQEEQQDQLWKLRDQPPPSWRPCDWKKLHHSMLRSFVEGRMDKFPSTSGDQVDQSTLQEVITSMGKQLQEDLLLVVDGLKSCYPPEIDICNLYARTYHQTFGAKLRKILDLSLEDKDSTFLLCWVNEYYLKIFEKPGLASEIDVKALGKLLPNELLAPLEEHLLSERQTELMTYISQVLKDAEQKWINGEEPKREDGCYVSPVAYDIIQFINSLVTSVEKVVGDLRRAQSITAQLHEHLCRFRSLHDDIIRQNRLTSKAHIKAHLSCGLTKNSRLFPEDVQRDCLRVLSDMKHSASVYLLSSLHHVLKPQYRMLGTYDWLNNCVFKKLLDSIETEIQDLKGVTESCHQELICQFHREVTAEYLKRLLKRKVKLNSKDQQHQAYMIVTDNAESLHKLFSKMASKQDWLKEILIRIAEVLKLQDLPAIQVTVASLGSAFPDLSEKHVSALLKLKTNFSKADRKTVKETLKDTLREIAVTDALPFFSNVVVG